MNDTHIHTYTYTHTHTHTHTHTYFVEERIRTMFRKHENIFYELLRGLISGTAQKEGFTRRKISCIGNNKHVAYFKGTNFPKIIP